MAVDRKARVAAHRQRMKEQGLSSITVWVDKETVELLKRLEGETRMTKGEVVSKSVKRFAQTPAEPPKDIKDIVREIIREEFSSQESEKAKPAKKKAQPKPKNDQSSQVLERIKALRADGLSFQKIADQLNEEGIPTRSGKGIWRKGAVGVLVKQL